ncbi:MAG: hypothetical protein ACPGXK_00905 [Phycisphaerae bacterium]
MSKRAFTQRQATSCGKPMLRWLPAIVVAAFVMAVGSSSAIAQHNADLWIGERNGKLDWQESGGLQPSSVYHQLDPVDTFLRGWSDNDPGFDHVRDVAAGVGPLPNGVDVMIEVVAMDPALYLIDNSFQILFEPGDSTLLGDEGLHTHLTWFVDEQDPQFDETQCLWEGTFRLYEQGGDLQDSEEFTLLFSNVPVRRGGFPPTDEEADGDFDIDFDVDRDDHAAAALCMDGPGIRPAPDDPFVTTCEVDCHNAFDFDNDLDVDLRDFALLQTLYSP